MNKGIRKIYLFLLSIMLLVTVSGTVYAEVKESKIYVTDDAGLLTGSEVASLREDLSILSEKWGCDIVVVTTDSTGEKTITEYADDFYDYNIYEDDGVLLLIDMETRGWWISTTGTCIDAFTDKGIQWIGEKQIVPYLSDGEYYKAFKSYAKNCDKFLKQAEKGKPYDWNHMPVTNKEIAIAGLVSLVIGLVVSGITLLVLASGNKSVRSVKDAASYVIEGSMVVSNSNDVFINKTVTKVPIPRDTDSRSGGGGGSTIHMGSSGTSHGGGGGHF